MSTIETEKNDEYEGYVIGRLGDLHIGNPDGIPSTLATASPEHLNEVAMELAQKLKEPTDLTVCSCIDGRCRLRNADGSVVGVRLHRVGGTASNLGVALNAESPIVATLPREGNAVAQAQTVDVFVTSKTGFEQSAHTGGCGGADGEVDDNKAIASSQEILAVTKALIDMPQIRTYLAEGYEDQLGEGSLFDDVLAERGRQNAGKTAQYLELNGWNGQDYVDAVTESNPSGVEELEVDHDDKKFHGHKEKALVIIFGDKTLDEEDYFVWNLKTSRSVARALAGERGFEGYKQAIIMEIAKHVAVANRLPSTQTPVILLAN